MTQSRLGFTNRLGATINTQASPAVLKDKEVEIFNKQYHVQ